MHPDISTESQGISKTRIKIGRFPMVLAGHTETLATPGVTTDPGPQRQTPRAPPVRRAYIVISTPGFFHPLYPHVFSPVFPHSAPPHPGVSHWSLEVKSWRVARLAAGVLTVRKATRASAAVVVLEGLAAM